VVTGFLQQAVLMVLHNAGAEVTTLDIYEALLGKYEPISTASIFITLERMHGKGLVGRRKGDQLPQRGGKARIYYLITKAGRAALLDAQKRKEMLESLSCARPRSCRPRLKPPRPQP
jgi:DNA-binding PadR family transcriptional regulator